MTVGMRTIVGAKGFEYEIPDYPMTFAGWFESMGALMGVEMEGALKEAIPHRRWFSEFCRQRWDIVLTASVCYLLFVFVAPRLFFGGAAGNGKSRFSATVATPFALWNLGLSLFSCWGVYQTLPNFFKDDEVQSDGYLCTDPFTRARGVENLAGSALLIFIFSKLVELGDTVFLIIKNRPVALLQWYHHVSVMLFCWHALATEYAPGMWFAVMNYSVHSIMYMYFAVYTKIKPARKFLKRIGPAVTLMQTSQMVVGIFVNGFAAYNFFTGKDCHVIDTAIYAALVMYFSYFVLFAKLFYDSVIRTKKAMTESCERCKAPKSNGQNGRAKKQD